MGTTDGTAETGNATTGGTPETGNATTGGTPETGTATTVQTTTTPTTTTTTTTSTTSTTTAMVCPDQFEKVKDIGDKCFYINKNANGKLDALNFNEARNFCEGKGEKLFE